MPLQATAPPGLREASNKVKIFPLTTSTPKSQILFPTGVLVISARPSLDTTSEAPKLKSNSSSDSLPVTAVTFDPNLERSITAIDPTPPVEPVTIVFVPENPL